MAFSINGSGRLLRDGRTVEQIPARPNHTGGAFARRPQIVVMHFTYGGTGRSSAEWFRNAGNTGRSSAQVVVDRDGSVIQCVGFDTVAFHAGQSRWRGIDGLNRHSFGIELANWGYLQRRQGGWVSYTGAPVADPVLAAHRNGNPDGSTGAIGWEPYSAPQLEAAEGIVRAIVARYGVTEIIGHDDISKGRKWDPGPAFDMARFRARVFEDQSDDRDGSLVVAVAEGLNLRRGPGVGHEVIALLPRGTHVSVVERAGNWLLVNELNGDGAPVRTGWVHGDFLD